MSVSVGALADLVLARAPGLGDVRLVCIDGPAGSGKTTLAALLAQRLGAPVLHLDDLYEGWSGLEGVAERLDSQVLQPLSQGRDARYQRYDWDRGRFDDWVDLPLPAALVVEGCGSGDAVVGGRASLIVWVEAPDEIRLTRGLARDGEAMRGEWVRWMELERAHFGRERTRERAEVLMDGCEALLP